MARIFEDETRHLTRQSRVLRVETRWRCQSGHDRLISVRLVSFIGSSVCIDTRNYGNRSLRIWDFPNVSVDVD